MKNTILALFLSVFAGVLLGQSLATPGISVIGYQEAGVNYLRWVPANYANWQALSQQGYHLYRYPMGERGADFSAGEQLTTVPLRAKSLEELKAQFGRDHQLAAIAAQGLYGEIERTPEAGLAGGIVARHTQEENLFGFAMLAADADPELARALGLGWADKTAIAGKSYVYEVAPAVVENPVAVAGRYFLEPTAEFPLPRIEALEVVEKELEIELRWNPAENPFPASGYWIERSLDGGRNVKRLNPVPFIVINNSVSDSLVGGWATFRVPVTENYVSASYRVRPFDAFGRMAEDVSWVVGMGRDRTPPATPLPQQVQQLPEGSLISWRMLEEPTDLAGYFVASGPTAEGPYSWVNEKLLAPNQKAWLDTKPAAPGEKRYYTVTAIDTAGNFAQSLPINNFWVDSLPPAPPQGLKASIDTTGLLSLQWAPNQEKDLMGYNVFFANADDHLYTQLNSTPITSPNYTHHLSLKTLTEEIYYRVVAMDGYFNASDYSQVLKVDKPDLIAPVAPQIKQVTIGATSIDLQLLPSPSKDVTHTEIRRRELGQNDWERLALLDGKPDVYQDRTALAGKTYQYSIRCHDDASLWSAPSAVMQVQMTQASNPAGITAIQLQMTSTRDGIELSWQNPVVPSGYRLQLYRAINEGPLRLLKSLPAEATSYQDLTTNSGDRYQYGLQVVYDYGGESLLTESEFLQF